MFQVFFSTVFFLFPWGEGNAFNKQDIGLTELQITIFFEKSTEKNIKSLV